MFSLLDPRNQVNIEQKEAWQNNFVLIQHEFPLIAQSFDTIKETINKINLKLAEVRSSKLKFVCLFVFVLFFVLFFRVDLTN
jgi:hypothetical protein